MIHTTEHDDEDLLELIAGKVLGDLPDSEQLQLESRIAGQHDETLAELERAAAAVELVFHDRNAAQMPDWLSEKIRSGAPAYLPAAKSGETAKQSEQSRDSAGLEGQHKLGYASVRWTSRELFAWLSCAASLLLAAGLWFSGNRQPRKVSYVEARQALIEESADLVQVDWADGKTPFSTKVVGDVVWSTTEQKGFMRFSGMPVNDPTAEQYQLWIIDPQRDDEPVDGGVFDIVSDSEVIVPIEAKLRVVDPVAFAITIEKPGGVVVSTQEQLPLLASVP